MSVRSYLYVPADRPDRIAKSVERGADAVILDLEDSIAPLVKETARANAAQWLESVPEYGGQIWVRVNSGDLLTEDLDAVCCNALTGIYLPKATRESVERLDSILDSVEISKGLQNGSIMVTALIETAEGLLGASKIARAARVVRLALGEADLKSELGISPSEDERELAPIRMQVVLASSAASLDPPTAGVSTDYRNLEALQWSTSNLKRMGFGSRSAIHPDQIAVINEVFTPTPEEIEVARELITTYERAKSDGTGATTGPDGRMIDEAVVRAARKLVEGTENTS